MFSEVRHRAGFAGDAFRRVVFVSTLGPMMRLLLMGFATLALTGGTAGRR